MVALLVVTAISTSWPLKHRNCFHNESFGGEEDIGKQRANSGKQVRKPRRPMSENSRTETHSQNQKAAQTKSENKTESENKNQKTTENWREKIQKMGVTTALFCPQTGT